MWLAYELDLVYEARTLASRVRGSYDQHYKPRLYEPRTPDPRIRASHTSLVRPQTRSSCTCSCSTHGRRQSRAHCTVCSMQAGLCARQARRWKGGGEGGGEQAATAPCAQRTTRGRRATGGTCRLHALPGARRHPRRRRARLNGRPVYGFVQARAVAVGLTGCATGLSWCDSACDAAARLVSVGCLAPVSACPSVWVRSRRRSPGVRSQCVCDSSVSNSTRYF